jgi:monoamine oxidase
VYALCGFLFDEDLDILSNEQAIYDRITLQLTKIYGDEARTPLRIAFKSWRDDPMTNCKMESFDTDDDPNMISFGHPLTYQKHGFRVFFAGTETMPGESGHMNGAVLAGYRAAGQLYEIIK